VPISIETTQAGAILNANTRARFEIGAILRLGRIGSANSNPHLGAAAKTSCDGNQRNLVRILAGLRDLDMRRISSCSSPDKRPLVHASSTG
jgi:hypothetical protein